MSNESETKPARRVEDKRAESAVDWTDAPRFTALGIAETWAVAVEAEGQRVLCISHEHVAGLDGECLEQFFPTIRSCAQHLLGFIGASPMTGTAGITLAAPAAVPQPAGDLTDAQAWKIATNLFGTVRYVSREEEYVKLANAADAGEFARAAIAAHLARQAQAEPILYARQWELDAGPKSPEHGIITSTTIDGDWNVPLYLAAPVSPAGAPKELRNAFMTLESNGGEGRTIVLKFNNRSDAYAVHDFLLKGGGREWTAAAQNIKQARWEVGNLLTMSDSEYPGMGGMFAQVWQGDDLIARVYGDSADEVRARATQVATAQNAEAIRNQALEEAAKVAIKLTAIPRDLLGPATAPMKTTAAIGEKIADRIRSLQTGSANTQEGGAT
jgi:hypothetical protein